MMAVAALSGLGAHPAGAQRARASRPDPVPQETGQFATSGTIVWLRVADDGSVLVYAARGFRSAFAHPSVLTAEETDRWADAVAAFLVADSSRARSAAGDIWANGGRPADTAVHAVLGDGDVTLDERTIGQASTLVLRVGVIGGSPVTAVFPPLALRPVVATLRVTAHVSRAAVASHQAAVPAPAAAPATALQGASPPPPPPSLPAQPSGRPPVTATAALPVAAVGPTPTPLTPASLPISPPPPGAVHPTASPAAAAPGAAGRQVGVVSDAPESRIEYSARRPVPHSDGAAPRDSAPPRVDNAALPPVSSTSALPGAPARPPAASPRSLAPDSAGHGAASNAAGDSVAERALSSEGRLPPSTLGDVIRQRQQLLQYCYTEFGLKTDATLSGQIVVRIVIQPDGTVSDVTVPRHSWSGHAADLVESCLHDRVLRWQFPTAQRASTHEIQLIFGR